MNNSPTNDGSVTVRPENRMRLDKAAALILGIALLSNVAWIGFLSWLIIRTTQFMVAGS